MTMLEFISTVSIDEALLAFAKHNLVTLGLAYAVLRAMFPESKILKALGDSIGSLKRLAKRRKK